MHATIVYVLCRTIFSARSQRHRDGDDLIDSAVFNVTATDSLSAVDRAVFFG